MISTSRKLALAACALATLTAGILRPGTSIDAAAANPSTNGTTTKAAMPVASGPVVRTAEAARVFKTLGRADAPVTILEFTDLQCPYCAEFALKTLPLLRQRYVDKGLVKFVSYDLPLGFHAYAMPAAVAARCAGEQGAYWPYRERLYRQQALLPAAPYAQLARSLGLDVARFEACRGDVQQQALIVADAEKAVAKGIRSTPTFVVGRLVDGQFIGEVIAGAQPIEVFEARLQPLLQQAKQPTRD